MNASTFINRYQYTPPLELYHLSIVYIFSHFLILSILTCFPILDTTRYYHRRIFIESTVLTLPFLLSVTLLQSISTIIPYLLAALALHLIFSHSKVFVVLKWPEIVFHSRPMPVKLPLITNLFANVILTVSIVILAVDFQIIFPDRLSKSRVYGWTLMDTGVSYFVALNAFLSPESRLETSQASSSLPTTSSPLITKLRTISISNIISPSIPLFILGTLRMILVNQTGYHQEITEYGASWNFFIVLGLTRSISSLIAHFSSSYCKLSIIIGLSHQVALSLFGLNSFILSPKRSGYLAANKEGIFSLPGYITIYLFMIWIGKLFYRKRKRRSNFDNILLIADVLMIATTLAIVGLFANHYIEPICRRQCNLAFICATTSLIMFIGATELGVAVLIDVLRYFGYIKKPPLVKSLLNEAVARKGLSVFLFANLLTGLINLTLSPKTRGPLVSFICLTLYSYGVSFFAIYWHFLGVANFDKLISSLPFRLPFGDQLSFLFRFFFRKQSRNS